MKKFITMFANSIYKALGIVALLIMWEGLSFFFPHVIVPSVEEIFSSLQVMVVASSFWGHLYHTVFRVFVGFGFSLITGGILGMLAGFSKRFYDLIKPVIVVTENAPPVLWVILAVIWFGLGDAPPVFAIMSVDIPIVTVNVAQGINSIDPYLLEMGRAFGVSRITEFLKEESITEFRSRERVTESGKYPGIIGRCRM